MKYVSVALVCYVGVLVLLLLWGRGDAFTLSILGENGLSINLYTILFIAFFGIGYGAYYATADMPSPWWLTAPTTRPTAAASISPASWAPVQSGGQARCPACPLPLWASRSALWACRACPPV
mgnify:CR=1 FL=1